jgi:hypothetical protein
MIASSRSVSSWKYEFQVDRSNLPGIDETATLAESVILQTHV